MRHTGNPVTWAEGPLFTLVCRYQRFGFTYVGPLLTPVCHFFLRAGLFATRMAPHVRVGVSLWRRVPHQWRELESTGHSDKQWIGNTLVVGPARSDVYGALPAQENFPGFVVEAIVDWVQDSPGRLASSSAHYAVRRDHPAQSSWRCRRYNTSHTRPCEVPTYFHATLGWNDARHTISIRAVNSCAHSWGSETDPPRYSDAEIGGRF